jgi:hypothetical protein
MSLAPKKSMRPMANPNRPPVKSQRPVRNPMYDTMSKESIEARTLRPLAKGGKLKMVEKGGKKVPSFAADGVGKMAMGGKCRGMGAAKKGGKYAKNG